MIYRFKPTLLPTCFFVFFFPLLLSLGGWQLHRYHWKQALIAHYQKAQQQEPIALQNLKTNDTHLFRKVTVTGHYLKNKTIVLQHRRYQGRSGVEILTPFKVAHSGKILLVNRGWVDQTSTQITTALTRTPSSSSSDMTRGSSSPVIPAKAGIQNITGTLKTHDAYVFTLGANILHPHHWPLMIQKVDIAELKRLTGWALYPYTLRLSPNAPNGFTRDWPAVNLLPQRHLGYAIQWFAMALTLLVAYVLYSR